MTIMQDNSFVTHQSGSLSPINSASRKSKREEFDNSISLKPSGELKKIKSSHNNSGIILRHVYNNSQNQSQLLAASPPKSITNPFQQLDTSSNNGAASIPNLHQQLPEKLRMKN